MAVYSAQNYIVKTIFSPQVVDLKYHFREGFFMVYGYIRVASKIIVNCSNHIEEKICIL